QAEPDAGPSGRRKRMIGRAHLFATLDSAVERGQSLQKERLSGQTSLFGLMDAASTDGSTFGQGEQRYPDVPDWSPKEQLGFEKETLGFYITGHPLDRYSDELGRYTTARSDTLADKKYSRVVMAGIVTEYRERPLKSGNGR